MAQHHDFKVKNGLVVSDSGTFGNTITGTDAVFSGSIAATGTISGSNLPVSFIDSAYVTSQIDAVIDAAPGALDTLNELAAALGDDANFSATITNAIAALPDSSQVSAIILNDVDSAYIQLRQSTTDAGLDSALTTQLIDSAYIQLRDTPQDFAYGSLTGAPTNVSDFTNDAGYLTSASASGIDSAAVISIIDSAYVENRLKFTQGGFGALELTAVSTGSNSAIWTFSTDAQAENFRLIINGLSFPALSSGTVIAFSDAAGNLFGPADNYNTVSQSYTITATRVGSVVTLSWGRGSWFNFTNYSGGYSAAFTAGGGKISLVSVFSGLRNTGPGSASDPYVLGEQISAGNYFGSNPPVYGAAISPSYADSAVRSIITSYGYSTYDSSNTTGMLSTYATQTYVTNAIDNLVDGAPGTLDTLNEIAAALNDDDSAYGTLLALINAKTNYDSANTIGLIDSAYVQLRQTAVSDAGLDSALTIQLIDSAYVAARSGGGTADSGTITSISSRVWRMDSLGELDLLNTHTGLGVANGDANVGDIAYKLNPFDGYVLTNIAAAAVYSSTGFVLASISGNAVTRLPFATLPAGQLPSQNFVINQSIAQDAAGTLARTVTAVSDTGGSQGKGYIDVTPALPSGFPTSYSGITLFASTADQTTWQTFGIDSAIVTSLAGGLDSASVTELVDSAYVQLRTKTTAIVTVSAGKFVIDGLSQPIIKLQPGRTYRFDQSNPSNANHPFRFSITNDGTHNGGSAYTTGVIENGTPGSVGAYTEIEVDFATPALYYYCGNHSGMGGASDGVYQSNVFTSIYVSGQDVLNADSARDKLIFEAGPGISITTDANTDTITIINDLNADVARGIIDSAYVQERQTHYLDSALVTQLIDSAYVQARQSGGGGGGSAITVQDEGSSLATAAEIINFVGSGVVASGAGTTKTITVSDPGLDSSLVTQLIDSDYIATKVDFTRGEFYNNRTTITADSGQTVFNYTSLDPANLDIYVNGLLLPPVDYTATTSAVTITVGANVDDEVQIVEKRGRILTQRGLVENKYYFTTPTPITAITGADDNGTTLDYSSGFLDVYLNGLLLKDSDDYSTNAGSTVTLISATDSGDTVTLINRKGVVVSPNVKKYEFIADSGQTVFSGSDANGSTLSYVPDAVQVHLNGILLRNLDYTANNGSSILLETGATATDEVTISAFSNPGQNMDLYQFTADSGQTVFSGNDLQGKSLAYMPGNIQVFLNGLLLNDSDDYTALNGVSVNLTSGTDASDEIKIAAFTSNTNYTPLNQWIEPSYPYSATAGDKIFVDTSSAKTITLPSSATMGDEIRIIDVTGNAATNNITVSRNGHNIQGTASDLTINIARAGIGLVYYNVAQGWVLIEN